MTASRGPARESSEELVVRLRRAGCVFAEDEARLLVEAEADPVRLEALVVRRCAGEPLEYLLGWAEFAGLRLAVEAGVFVPRRRTAVVLDAAIPLLRAGDIALDLCCGTGALAAALAVAVPGVRLVAVDIDPAAVRCATVNLAPFAGSVIHVECGDLFAAVPGSLRGRLQVIVANAPYVPTGAVAGLPPEARDHEARAALDGGADGLEVQRRIAEAASSWLAPGGALIFETGAPQAPATVRLLEQAGLRARVVRDEAVDGTAVIGVTDALARPVSG